MSKLPSAWESVVGEPAQVSYWKWRVRRVEALTVLAFSGGFALGFALGALAAVSFGR
jgi:hypothetical protein